MRTDQASLNKRQDDSGCGDMQLYPIDGVLRVTGAKTLVR
jgi:hypothetical protein